MGVILAATTGYWQLLGFSALNAFTALVAGRYASRRGGKSGESQPKIEIVEDRFVFAGRKLPSLLMLWTPAQKQAVLTFLRHRNHGSIRQRIRDAYAAERLRPSIILGLDPVASSPVALDLDAQSHTLIVGPTGTGKSALLSRILAELNNPDFSKPPVQLWFFDFKSGETIHENAANLRSARLASSANPESVDQTWKNLLAGLDDAQMTRNVGHILIIEELSAALADRSTAETLIRLAAQGRSKGLRIIVTNQSSSGIPRSLLVNLGNRILLDGSDSAERMLLAQPEMRLADSQAKQAEPSPESGIFGASYLNRGIAFKFLPVWSE